MNIDKDNLKQPNFNDVEDNAQKLYKHNHYENESIGTTHTQNIPSKYPYKDYYVGFGRQTLDRNKSKVDSESQQNNSNNNPFKY